MADRIGNIASWWGRVLTGIAVGTRRSSDSLNPQFRSELMRLAGFSSFTRFAAVMVVAASLTGCGSKLDGTYVPEGGAGLISSITFKSGGKCELTGLGMTKEGTYELEGQKVKITVSGETNILTMDDKGCLDGGGIIGRFCKGSATDDNAGSSRSSASSSAKTSGAPSGLYECNVPDGSKFTLEFSAGGKCKMAMIEHGQPDVTEGNWVLNGDDIMIQSTDGMPMNLKRNGTSLVADMGGMQMTFVKK
jgi:hypothetical protein